jgi:hypothetical protein
MTMRTAANFRLSQHSVSVLSILEHKLHKSKTAIMEQALHDYANKKLAHQNPLLAFAGILSESEADTISKVIASSRRNKKTR